MLVRSVLAVQRLREAGLVHHTCWAVQTENEYKLCLVYVLFKRLHRPLKYMACKRCDVWIRIYYMKF